MYPPYHIQNTQCGPPHLQTLLIRLALHRMAWIYSAIIKCKTCFLNKAPSFYNVDIYVSPCFLSKKNFEVCQFFIIWNQVTIESPTCASHPDGRLSTYCGCCSADRQSNRPEPQNRPKACVSLDDWPNTGPTSTNAPRRRGDADPLAKYLQIDL